MNTMFWKKRRKKDKKSAATAYHETIPKQAIGDVLKDARPSRTSMYLPNNEEGDYENIPYYQEGIDSTEIKELPDIPHSSSQIPRLKRYDSIADYSSYYGTCNTPSEQATLVPRNLVMYNALSLEEAIQPSSVHVTKSILFGHEEEVLKDKKSKELLSCLQESNGNKRQGVIQYIKNKHIPRLTENRNYNELFQLLSCQNSPIMLLVLRELQHMIMKDSIELHGFAGKESFSFDEIHILLDAIKRCMADISILPNLIHTTCIACCNLVLREQHVQKTTNLLNVHAIFRRYFESNNLLGEEATVLTAGLDSLIKGMLGDTCETNGLAIADWKSFLKNDKALRERISSMQKLPLKDKLCLVFMVSSNVLYGRQFFSRVEHYSSMLKQCYEIEDRFLTSVTDFLALEVLRNIDSGKELGDVIDHVIKSNPELMLYHPCPVIRRKCMENEPDTIHVTCRHIEVLLHRMDFSIEKQKDGPASSIKSKSISCLCEVNGKYGNIHILMPSVKDVYDFPTKRYSLPPDVGYVNAQQANELDILRSLHDVDCSNFVVDLYVHQWTPKPFFYITERGIGENLSSYLLSKRVKEEIVPPHQLLRVICQTCRAVDFLHGQGIVHRDVTASAFECFMEKNCSNDLRVKLQTFNHATHLWKPGDLPKLSICGDVNVPENLPFLWTAPESFQRNLFSRFSDTWMVIITAYEIYAHGRWPMIKDFNDSDNFKDLMKGVINHDTRPSQPPSMPTRIHGLLLSGLSRNPEDRKGLPDIIQKLEQEISSLGNTQRSSADSFGSSEEYRSPVKMMRQLTEYQCNLHSKPLRGDVSRFFHQMEEDNDDHEDSETYYRRRVRRDQIRSYFQVKFQSDKENPGIVAITELVPDMYRMDDLKSISEEDARKLQMTPWPPKIKWQNHKALIHYNIPCGQTLQYICSKCIHGGNMRDYVPILLELAQIIEFYHSRQITLNCVRSKHIWIQDANYQNEDKFKISVPRMAFLKRIPENDNFSNDFVMGKIDDAMSYWSPPEMLEIDAKISKQGDSFSFGRLIEEMSLLLQNSAAENEELSTIPLGNVPVEQLPNVLQKGMHMERQSNCPEWLYEEIVLPCIRKERIERPSFHTIIEIMNRRLSEEHIYENFSTHL